jgi:hypothetical protein
MEPRIAIGTNLAATPLSILGMEQHKKEINKQREITVLIILWVTKKE